MDGHQNDRAWTTTAVLRVASDKRAALAFFCWWSDQCQIICQFDRCAVRPRWRNRARIGDIACLSLLEVIFINKLQVCFIHHLKVLKKTLWCCIFRYRRGRAALFANYFRNDGTHKHKTSFCSVWMQILCTVVNSALDKTPWHCGVVSVCPANNTQYQRLIQTRNVYFMLRPY